MKVVNYILIFTICIFATPSYAQNTSNTKSPEQLVKEVLAGKGVQISNVTFKGYVKQRGEFSGVSNIGLSSGVIISSGTVLDENNNGKKTGPKGPNNNNGAVSVSNTPFISDIDLANLAGRDLGETKDVAAIEFDFIPEGDSIIFRYVFASEEYPRDFSTGNGPPKNDVFGFFISGPGFVGNQNIALLNDGVTSVSATTVNPSVNSNLYVDNGTGFSGTPQFTDASVTNYDGFTKVLTARAKVVPCQVYHLKLAVCDVGDGLFDTSVFLEANSLKSEPKYSIEQSSNKTPGDTVLFPDTKLVAGCINGEVIIKRTEKLNQALVVPFTVSGSAINGTDYTLSHANSVTFNPGVSEVKVVINTIDHPGLIGSKDVTLSFDNPKVCDANPKVDFKYTIQRNTPLVTQKSTNNVTCSGEAISISASSTGGVPDYRYSWRGRPETTKSINVSPLATTSYYYRVTDFCNQVSTEDTVTVVVPVYAPLSINSSSDRNVRCKGERVTISTQANGGAGDFTYLWNTNETNKLITPQILSSKEFEVVATDKCGSEISDKVNVTLTYPELVADGGNDFSVCVGDEIELKASANGGIPRKNGESYTYFWDGNFGKDYLTKVGRSADFILSVYDSCNIVPALDTVSITANQPTANFEINNSIPEPNEDITLIDLSSGATSWVYSTGDGRVIPEDNGQNPVFQYTDEGDYVITQRVYDVNGCSDSLSKLIKIQPPLYYYLPNSFTPNGDFINDVFVGKGVGIIDFSMQIFDRWGNIVFTSNDPNVGWDGIGPFGSEMPQGVYVVKYSAKGYNDNKTYDYVQTVVLIR
jgi:gliding motility-associated-like protein